VSLLLNRDAVAKLLADPETLATTLHVIVLNEFREALYDMDMLEILRDLEDKYGCRVSEQAENRLNAILLAVTTDAFFDDLEAFKAICNSLSSGDIGDTVENAFDEVTVPEIMWAVYEVGINRDHEGDFAGDISAFIERTLESEANDPDAEIDEPEDVTALPYMERYVSELRTDLRIQLTLLGVDAQALMKLDDK
jgi:hypothetical protein